MNTNIPHPDDTKLSSLLRESRVAPSPPPRFQENVWRRIADAEAETSADTATWFDVLIAGLFRPRFAFAGVALLLLAGALAGMHEGGQAVRTDAQARYFAAVAPHALR